MTVTNTTVKPIGFGGTILLPGETKALPGAFADSPLTAFYLSRGWLKAVGKDSKPNPRPAAEAAYPIQPEVGGGTVGGEGKGKKKGKTDDPA